MNLLSKLFGNKPAPQLQPKHANFVRQHPAYIAPEVWANFGVDVEEIDFEEYEALPSAARQREIQQYS